MKAKSFLPAATAALFAVDTTVTASIMDYGPRYGTVNYGTLTVAQAESLINRNFPHIRRKQSKPKANETHTMSPLPEVADTPDDTTV